MDTIAYTHWAYFDTMEDAARYLAVLPTFDMFSVEPTERGEILVRFSRTIPESSDWHEGMTELAAKHNGRYDGGEAGATTVVAEWLLHLNTPANTGGN